MSSNNNKSESDEPIPRLKLSGLSVNHLQTEFSTRRDLILNIWDKKTSSESSLHGGWLYKRDIFDADTIAHITRNFNILLEKIVSDPEKRVCEYEVSV